MGRIYPFADPSGNARSFSTAVVRRVVFAWRQSFKRPPAQARDSVFDPKSAPVLAHPMVLAYWHSRSWGKGAQLDPSGNDKHHEVLG